MPADPLIGDGDAQSAPRSRLALSVEASPGSAFAIRIIFALRSVMTSFDVRASYDGSGGRCDTP